MIPRSERAGFSRKGNRISTDNAAVKASGIPRGSTEQHRGATSVEDRPDCGLHRFEAKLAEVRMNVHRAPASVLHGKFLMGLA